MPEREVRGNTIAELLVATFLLMSCADRKEPAGPTSDQGVLRPQLVGEAANRFRSNETFLLSGPQGETRPTVSAAQASAYAELAARQFGPFLQRDLEAQHKGAIAFKNLKSCREPLYARSSFEPPPSGVSASVAYYLGSYWLVSVCNSSGQLAVSVAIAINAIEIRIDKGVLFPAAGSIKMVGIPPSWDGAVPGSAERAAVRAAQETGARISGVPVLIAPNPLDAFPQGAFWSIGLDKEIEVRPVGGMISRTSATVFVGSETIPRKAMERGPLGLFAEGVSGRRSLPFTDWDSPGLQFSVRVRPGVAIDIEKAHALKGDQ